MFVKIPMVQFFGADEHKSQEFFKHLIVSRKKSGFGHFFFDVFVGRAFLLMTPPRVSLGDKMGKLRPGYQRC